MKTDNKGNLVKKENDMTNQQDNTENDMTNQQDNTENDMTNQQDNTENDMTNQQDNPETVQEIHKVLCAQDEFSSAMRARLYDKCVNGCRGWNIPENKGNIKVLMAGCVDGLLRDSDHIKAIDVANFAMMLYFIIKAEEQLES